jgi:arylsulfatase A-like enzyme
MSHRIPRREFLTSLLGGSMIAALSKFALNTVYRKEGEMSRRPNLLFVFADQMRGMDMGCAGNDQVQTPNMDRLASEGALFTHAYANCPVCTPSRATILTGRYPLSHRALANDLPLPTSEVTIAELLRESGYRTGYIGKWHLDGVPRSRFTPPGPRRGGFDFWAAWNCAHSYFNGKLYRDTPEPIKLEGYEPVGQTDLAIRFLKEDDGRPFCLFLSWGPPHAPYDQVPERYKSLYDPAQIRLRPNVRPKPPRPFKDITGGRDPKTTIAHYYAHITALDEQLGRLLKALEELNLDEDTIVVFTSDHGDMLWSQGMAKKEQPWEESIQIPFIIRWRGRIPAGHRCDMLISTVDFAPTLLGLMGFEVPGYMEGMDLSHIVLGEKEDEPESVFLTGPVIVDQGLHQGIREWRGVRTKRYTYARWFDGEGWVLYDNEADPYQLNNLIDSPQLASIRDELESMLQGWLKRTGDGSLPWDELIRRLGLSELWNARERELHPKNPRILK